MNDFETVSPTGRVRLVRSSACPDPKGYFLYLDGSMVRRYAGLAAGRSAFRTLADANDPPRPVAPDAGVAAAYATEVEVARWYGERKGMFASEGGRRKVRR